ncbi:MAG TPA: SRPBCC family protein [Trebonia sp.]|jgi:carbon monoxide dehydrogenase subunit G|nr:SRPBCC family protein [Trebonia sp.]
MAIELDNSFTVPVAPEQAWDVLLDVERIAPCMPGASVTSIAGDEVAGQVKVKLGPLSLSYKGTAKFTEKDQDNKSISIEASGKETRGAGTASATVQAGLKPGDAEGSTLVSIHTSLNVTGRPAQFGRSLLPEVSGKLISQFATNLEALIAQDGAGAPADNAAAAETAETGSPAPADAAATGASPSAPAASTPTVTTAAKPVPAVQQEDSLNLVKLVGGPILRRVLPIAAGAAALALLGRRLRGVFRKSKS